MSRRAAIPVHAMLAVTIAAFLGAGCLQQPNTLNGRPLVAGMQICEGVPPEICQEQVASLRQSGNAPLVGFRITCTAPNGCTRQSGEAELGALLADGTVQAGSFGWAGAAPAP